MFGKFFSLAIQNSLSTAFRGIAQSLAKSISRGIDSDLKRQFFIIVLQL